MTRIEPVERKSYCKNESLSLFLESVTKHRGRDNVHGDVQFQVSPFYSILLKQ